MGHVVYEDGDLEDISIEEIKQLIWQGDALPGLVFMIKRGNRVMNCNGLFLR